MKQPLIQQELIPFIQNEVKVELESSYIYRAISFWCGEKGYINCKKFFAKRAEEELNHYNKIIDFCNDRNIIFDLPELDKQLTSFLNLSEVFNKFYNHEIFVENSWKFVVEKCKEFGDETCYVFSQWFVKEQIEEIGMANDLLTIISELDKGMYMWFDNEIIKNKI